MAETWYAWSPIRHDKGTTPQGEAVTAKGLGVDDENFMAMVEAGSIRAMKFPDMEKGDTRSPVEFLRDQVREMLGEDADEVLITAALAGGSYVQEGTEEEFLAEGVEKPSK